MIIQRAVFPDHTCDIEELYFRQNGMCTIQERGITLVSGAALTTDTYMNVLDMGFWKKYTKTKKIALRMRICGHFILEVLYKKDYSESVCCQKHEYRFENKTEITEVLPDDLDDGLFFFKIKGIQKTIFYEACYVTDMKPENEVLLAMDICTYHRNGQLEENLEKILNSFFFDPTSPLYGKLRIYVADNGDDFHSPCVCKQIKIFYNSNKGGGTGGYQRGLEEIRKRYSEYPCTHTIFMDDDVKFQMEGFYRLYAFLALLRSEYCDCSVAGRMFRMDRKNIQYTAVEKWNKGNIIHVGGNQDMTLSKNVQEEKNQTGEYGGWWLCVFPAQVILKNDPFPFFIHCDDVEYGLRQKKEVLTLRGFQVWHETYEYRINPKMVYYDVRNALAVNAMEGKFTDAEQVTDQWKQRMDWYHNEGRQTEKYMCALAMWDFGRGWIFKHRNGQLPEFQIWISRRVRCLRMLTPVLHRIAENYVRHNFQKIVKKYSESREEKIWQ